MQLIYKRIPISSIASRHLELDPILKDLTVQRRNLIKNQAELMY